MNYAQVYNDIKLWILDFLSVNNSDFNNLPPCPYAQEALVNGKIAIEIEKYNHSDAEKLLQDCEVVIYVYDPHKVTVSELEQHANIVNQTFPSLIALEDHPDDPEIVGNTCVNQGKYAQLLIQDRHKLERARGPLEKLGYYKNWKEQYKQDVVNR